jgi:secondary thiamine-phosphate synthase enzyme
MRQVLRHHTVTDKGEGLTDITALVASFVRDSEIQTGLLTIFCRHTSASLLIQENADQDVQADLVAFLRDLAPRDRKRYRHDAEGPDDMPAHLRTALTQTQLSIPVENGRPVLGTWQAIYLFEHRTRPHERKLVLHLIGE